MLPLGAFLCYHMFENLSALRGPAAYDEMVNHVNTLLPRGFFYGLELVTIVLPLGYHALYGVWVAVTGRPNVGRYAYAGNWGYLTQRITGVVALLFLLVHVGTLRTWVTLLGHHLAPVPPVTADGLDLVTYQDVAAHLGNPASLGVQSILAGDHIFALYRRRDALHDLALHLRAEGILLDVGHRGGEAGPAPGHRAGLAAVRRPRGGDAEHPLPDALRRRRLIQGVRHPWPNSDSRWSAAGSRA